MRSQRVWVAGHRGMVGSAVVRALAREGRPALIADRAEVDLLRRGDVDRFLGQARPDAIVLAAARVGGILANAERPADFLYENLVIAANVIDAAHRAGVERLLNLGSSCIYPKFAPQPISEDALLTGPLEPTNEAYAVAKIAGVKLTQAYRRQHGRRYVSLMPCNLYGPNDNFDLHTSHVLPALLRKVHEATLASAAEVVVWGTGRPLREFLHVDDLARAALFCLDNYDGEAPLNCGAGYDVSIAELAALIVRVVGYRGRLAFDREKPDGTPRKLMDSSRIVSLGWRAEIGLEAGVRATYDWYLAHA